MVELKNDVNKSPRFLK